MKVKLFKIVNPITGQEFERNFFFFEKDNSDSITRQGFAILSSGFVIQLGIVENPLVTHKSECDIQSFSTVCPNCGSNEFVSTLVGAYDVITTNGESVSSYTDYNSVEHSDTLCRECSIIVDVNRDNGIVIPIEVYNFLNRKKA